MYQMNCKDQLDGNCECESMGRFHTEYIKIFTGSCFGIGLSHRGKDDPHVMFTLLHEDDEYWWDDHKGITSFSSGWHSDIPKALAEAIEWCEGCCIPDTAPNGRQYGWKFREGI